MMTRLSREKEVRSVGSERRTRGMKLVIKE